MLMKGDVISKARAQWADKINAAWANLIKKTVPDIFRIGHLLREAKAKLEHGEFRMMLEHDLKFERNSAPRFMRIAIYAEDNQRFAKSSNLSLLPPCKDTLYKL